MTFEQYHEEMNKKRAEVSDQQKMEYLNIDELQRAVDQKNKEQSEAFYNKLHSDYQKKMKEMDRTNYLRMKAIQQNDEDYQAQMNQEIEEAKTKVEAEIKAKYEEKYGSKEWNSDNSAYHGLLNGLFSKEGEE